jgi:putative two-component system response regulator
MHTGERAPRVLVVDDDQGTRNTLKRMLRAAGYAVELARDGIEALAKLALDVDLVLLDAEMPGMDGFAVARRIRADEAHHDVPIIMVTGLDSREDRLRAVEAGVNDFIAKPVDRTELGLRSASLLRVKEATDEIKRHRARLEDEVARRTAELRRTLEEMAEAQRDTYRAHLDTIRRLVAAAEYKDRDTAAHIERIGEYCGLLARVLGRPPGEIELIRYASLMHDVGKIGIPDSVLLKPGALDAGEWEIMKQHTVIGARILHGSPAEVIQAGALIALTHHERWDGKGYPRQLSGNGIPLMARICAVTDVFDALTSRRPYRGAFPNATAYEMMRRERGRHFDPEVLDAFVAHRAEVGEIQARLRHGTEWGETR